MQPWANERLIVVSFVPPFNRLDSALSPASVNAVADGL